MDEHDLSGLGKRYAAAWSSQDPARLASLDRDGRIARSEGHFDEADYQRQLQAGTASSSQLWNAAQYARNARFVADLGAPVVDLLDPKPGESILDLGCGDGALTAGLVKAGCRVIGVDASADMIAAARTVGLDARVMDGQSLPFVGEFDAVFSNAALHWMKQPDRVIAGVWRALKPGGRFVGEMGGHGNVAHIVSALETAMAARGIAVTSPWYFPTPEAYRTLLEAGGFEVNQMELFPRPTVLPGDVGAWLETFAQPFTSALPEPYRPALIAELVDALRPVLKGADGHWRADYVRLRFSASRALSPS
ncbi:MAG: methyltransferase domain-containing protein [Proteobacteria bacterium]|nr:methyltransferase domain-containing protein [Pseudomonadota bacterium]